MLTPINVWFDRTATLLPQKSAFRLDLLRRAVEELQKRGVKFEYLPGPKPENLPYSLGKIRRAADDAFREEGCEGWVKRVRRCAWSLQDALKEDGVV